MLPLRLALRGVQVALLISIGVWDNHHRWRGLSLKDFEGERQMVD